MTNKALNVVFWGIVPVSRSELKRHEDKLETAYIIRYPEKIAELSYEIIE